MKYNDLTKDIMKFLILDMGNPTMADFKKFLNECRGVML